MRKYFCLNIFIQFIFSFIVLLFLSSHKKSPSTYNNSSYSHKMSYSDSFNVDVIRWLQEAPFDTDWKSGADFSYDKWIEKGRTIPYVIESLIMLLDKNAEKNSLNISVKAVYVLGWIGDKRKEIIDMLTKLLNSNNITLRVESVSALGHQGSSFQLSMLEVLLLNKKEDINIRANACIAIGRIGNPSSEKLLRKTLKDKSTFLSKCAEEALRLLRNKKDQYSSSLKKKSSWLG